METVVEHARPVQAAGPSPAAQQHPALIPPAPPATSQQPSKALRRQQSSTSGGPHGAAWQAAVPAAAAVVAALVRWGWTGAAVLLSRFMVAVGLTSFLTDVIVHLATTGRAAAAGAVCVTAAQTGFLHPAQMIFSFQAVQQLCTRLLTEGHVAAAAAVAEASWHIAGQVGMPPIQVARLLAAPAVAAVDGGRATAVAAVQRLLFGACMQPLLVWLLVEMIEGMDRPDAAAAAALEGLTEEGGAVLLGDLSALLMADGHHRAAAALAKALYHQGTSLGREQEAAGALAAGTAQAVEAGSVEDVVAVQWLLFEQGQTAVLRNTLAALTGWPAGAAAAGRLSWHAMGTGRERLVAATSLALLLAGRAHEAAAALEALAAAAGQQHARVARVAAAVMVDGVDGGAAASVAEANAQLWGCGLTPLLRDVMACAARQGWADAAAKVSRQALEQEHARMVVDVAAALVVEGAVEEAAQLAAHLAMAANFSPVAIQALSAAMATAVCSGAAQHTAAVASDLLHEGHQELLADVTTHLAASGHSAELAQLAAAVPQLRHSKVSPPELAGLLSRAVEEYNSGGGGGSGRAIARAARHSHEEAGLKQLRRTTVATASSGSD